MLLLGERDFAMGDEKRLVAVISPWEKLPELVKKQFRIESLPREKKVMVWREDLQTKEKLTGELKKLGIASLELRDKKVMTKWQDTD